MNNLTHKALNRSQFAKLLLKWHQRENKRQMPWKGERNPYKIWLSEIILQQTRVEQGAEYYKKFVHHFPTISDLSNADEKKVFKLWEGLGYYSRCRNLIATAKYIHNHLGAIFPNTYEEILRLKGIGPYTASAIASFAFNLPHAVVDGNVFRVLSRVFGISDAIDSTTGKKKFNQLAADLIDKNMPAEYNQAIMDFGATFCKPALPNCISCIFKNVCIAKNENSVAMLPVKEKKVIQRDRFLYFFVIRHNNSIAIRERLEKDIWQHLNEFPMIELNDEADLEQAMCKAIHYGWFSKNAIIKKPETLFKQKLTHQNIVAQFVQVTEYQKQVPLKNYDWIAENNIMQHSFPKVIKQYLSSVDYTNA